MHDRSAKLTRRHPMVFRASSVTGERELVDACAYVDHVRLRDIDIELSSAAKMMKDIYPASRMVTRCSSSNTEGRGLDQYSSKVQQPARTVGD
jgi:hypothetical protein